MNAPAKRILVVDDDELVGKAVASICSKLGYQATVVGTAADARTALGRGGWDGYVLDYSLPDGDGIELTGEIRSRGDPAPVIFITGFATPEMVLESQELGVLDVLAKPFKAVDLQRLLDRHIPLTGQTSAQPVATDRPAARDLSGMGRIVAVAFLVLLGLAVSAAVLFCL